MRSVDTSGSEDEGDSSTDAGHRRRSSLSESDGFATAQENDGPDLISFATPKPIERTRHASVPPEKDGQTQNVVVCVRVRPYRGGKEPRPGGPEDIWDFDFGQSRIGLSERHPLLEKRGGAVEDSYDFRYDSLISPHETTYALYSTMISPIVQATLEGYNGTIFAYGQTASVRFLCLHI